jgi:hypothetical protein
MFPLTVRFLEQLIDIAIESVVIVVLGDPDVSEASAAEVDFLQLQMQ